MGNQDYLNHIISDVTAITTKIFHSVSLLFGA